MVSNGAVARKGGIVTSVGRPWKKPGIEPWLGDDVASKDGRVTQLPPLRQRRLSKWEHGSWIVRQLGGRMPLARIAMRITSRNWWCITGMDSSGQAGSIPGRAPEKSVLAVRRSVYYLCRRALEIA
jgi:hypothetical protein